ncbi:MAG: GAF domain-containing protein, partial [Anaerolineae bacterium]|nr:GAF domain-containing protein [Anaerolineae bacterium]
YQHISIFTADTSETMLTLGAGSTVSPVDPAAPNPAYLLPVGDNSTVGQVAASLSPHHFGSRVERKYETPGHYPFEAQSGLVIPIIANRQLLGVIDVSSAQPACFDDSERWFFQAIAGQLAVKFENMRLLEEQERRLAELSAFNQIGMILAEHRDLETILTHTLQRVKSLFQVEGISLLLLEDNELHFVAAAGAEAEALKTHSLKPGQGIAWSVIESGKTIRVDNVKEDPRHFSGIDSAIEFSTSSLIAVPIRAAGRILGVLETMKRLDGQPLNHDDEVTLEFIVSFVAIAIENARLFMQIQRQVDRTTGLLEASRTLGTLNLQDTLNTIVQQAGRLLEAEHTVVYSVDKAKKKIRASAAHSIGEMINVPTPTFNFDEGTAGWVIANNESLVINNTQNDERFVHISPHSRLIGNLVTVPLTVQDEVIGALEACHKISKKRFGAEDKSLLAAFANQAAIAIHNAQLYQEKQQRIEALTTLSQASEAITKAPNLDMLLNTVLDSMIAIIGAKAGSVILAETQSLVLSIEAARGITPEVVAHFNKRKLSKSADLFGDSHPLRELIEVDDGETAPLVSPQGPNYESTSSPFTHVPLYSSDDFIGLIELHGLPTDNTRSLLRTVADMAAVAIDKARLFRETGQRLAEVSTLYTLAEQTTRVLDLARIIEFTVIIIKHAVGCDGCGLFIKEVDEKEETLTLKASNGWSEANLRREGFTFVSELARQLSKKSHPTYITDIREHYFSEIMGIAFTEPVDEEIKQAITEQFRSLMIVPLISKDRILGAFVISDSTPDAFGQSEGRLLTIAAAQIATAIENLKLYGNLEQRAIELEVALEKVEEANRLKSEFVQNVSHELRTPLT